MMPSEIYDKIINYLISDKYQETELIEYDEFCDYDSKTFKKENVSLIIGIETNVDDIAKVIVINNLTGNAIPVCDVENFSFLSLNNVI